MFRKRNIPKSCGTNRKKHVSYTHLDVYKRQGLSIILATQNMSSFKSKGFDFYACLLYTSIVKDDMDYLSSLHAVRRMNLNNVSLISEYNERTSADRNRLGSDFKKILMETFERNWLVTNFMPSLFTAAELDGIPEAEISEEDRVSQTLSIIHICCWRYNRTVSRSVSF